MSKRLRVYIAGPMSKGDFMENIHNGLVIGRRLFMEGFAPYVPHLDAYMFPISQAETPEREREIYEALLDWDFAWIKVSDALVRLEGYSEGADLEVQYAESLGIPVFYDDRALYNWRDRVEGYRETAELEAWPVADGNQDWPTYAEAIGRMNGMEGCE